MNKSNTFLFTLLIAWIPPCIAQGWLDYELDIGDGYNISRCNSIDISLCKGILVLIPTANDEKTGPLFQYYTGTNTIFTKHYGTKLRNLFKGDSFTELDTNLVFYFILVKKIDSIIGPMSKSAFERNELVKQTGQFVWKEPSNPNFWLPLIGTIYFIFCSIPFLVTSHPFVIIPILVFMIGLPTLALWFIIKRITGKRL